MANLNKVMLIGNLTRDPEIQYTPKGTAIASFGLAINRNYTTEAGEKKEEVTFIDVSAFGRVAEIIGEYCKKGNPLYVEGRLKLDQWDDKASGQRRQKLKVLAESIQLLASREKQMGAGDSEYADSQPARRSNTPATRSPASAPHRPPAAPHDPDLDVAPDDITF